MGKSSLSELLECIKDDYFEGSQQALAAAMGMQPSQLSRVMNEEEPTLTTERIVNLLNFLDIHRKHHTVSFDWLMRGKPRVRYPAHSDRSALVSDSDLATVTAEEFISMADRFGIECRRRGHKQAARALMDLVDSLDSATGVTASNADAAVANKVKTVVDAHRVAAKKPKPEVPH